MGTYNIIHCTIDCPRCGSASEVEAEVRFGRTAEMLTLEVGDPYPWVPHAPPAKGGRSEGGDMDGNGYMECGLCRKDAFLCVTVRGDVVTGVQPDDRKSGYIA